MIYPQSQDRDKTPEHSAGDLLPLSDQLLRGLSSAKSLALRGDLGLLARISTEIARQSDDLEAYEGAVEIVREVGNKSATEFLGVVLVNDPEPGKRKRGMRLLVEGASAAAVVEAKRLLFSNEELTATYFEIGTRLTLHSRQLLLSGRELAPRARIQLESLGERSGRKDLLDIEKSELPSAVFTCVNTLLRGDSKAFYASLEPAVALYPALPEALAGLILSSTERVISLMSNIHLNMKVQNILAAVVRRSDAPAISADSNLPGKIIGGGSDRFKNSKLAADSSLNNFNYGSNSFVRSGGDNGVVELVSFANLSQVPDFFPLLNEIAGKGGSSILPRSKVDHQARNAEIFFATRDAPPPLRYLALPWSSIEQVHQLRDAAIRLIEQGYFVEGMENRGHWGVVHGSNTPVLLNYSALRRVQAGERERLLELVESIAESGII